MKPRATLVVYPTRGRIRSQRWRWRLVHTNGKLLADSGEGYTDRSEALSRGAFIAQGGYEIDVP